MERTSYQLPVTMATASGEPNALMRIFIVREVHRARGRAILRNLQEHSDPLEARRLAWTLDILAIAYRDVLTAPKDPPVTRGKAVQMIGLTAPMLKEVLSMAATCLTSPDLDAEERQDVQNGIVWFHTALTICNLALLWNGVLAYKRCKSGLYAWLERAQMRMGFYAEGGVGRKRERDAWEALHRGE